MRRWIISAILSVSVPAIVAAKEAPAPEKPVDYSFEDKALDKVTSSELERFSGEREFARYREQFEAIKKKRENKWAGDQRPIVVAAATMVQSTAEPVEEVCTDPELCPPEDAAPAQEIVVTGSRVSAPTSVTNVQSVGVDEGDIVKQIGDYLLVLQDGRIFAIDMKTMKLTDRANVYRPAPPDYKKRYSWDDDFEGADWYDEMLVQGDHVLITAYSYDDDATELSVFKLDQKSGKVRSEGTFLITSDDYYDVDNYATRIVGDKLIIYTPYSLEQFEELEDRPVLRRWLPAAERKNKQDDGKPLFDARAIYKPVLRTGEPRIHSISVCPLGDFDRKKQLDCNVTAFIGPEAAEMYVSPNNVYLWNTTLWEADSWRRPDCVKNWDWESPYPAQPRADRRDVPPGAVYRMSIRTGDVGVIGVSGVPFDQFSMEESKGRFRTLVDWRTMRCDDNRRAPANVAYMSIRADEFDVAFQPLRDSQFVAAPSPGTPIVENRFAEGWLVYGGRERYGGYPPEKDDAPLSTKVVALPIDDPRDAKLIDLPHSIVRAERVGSDIMLNGYRDDSGLNMTLIGLDNNAAIRSTVKLPGRFESEGRSHAFNSVVDSAGEGIIGVPTVKRDGESGRWWWRSESSDLSFLTKAPDGKLTDVGPLIAVKRDDVATHPSYTCEVSCIDWYGNSRPVFIAGRIFGLMGTSLVEAKIADGKIDEVARIDLTAPLPGDKAD